jgi:hypothetical protein
MRKGLGDTTENGRYIETVAKRGCRFTATVSPVSHRPDERSSWAASADRDFLPLGHDSLPAIIDGDPGASEAIFRPSRPRDGEHRSCGPSAPRSCFPSERYRTEASSGTCLLVLTAVGPRGSGAVYSGRAVFRGAVVANRAGCRRDACAPADVDDRRRACSVVVSRWQVRGLLLDG